MNKKNKKMWKKVPKQYKWLAKDTQSWGNNYYLYPDRPMLNGDGLVWYDDGGHILASEYIPEKYLDYSKYARNSLIERPDGV